MMRKILFIVFIAFVTNAQAQIYYPLPDSNTVWSVSNLKYLVKGDTVYNSKTYKKYYYTFDTSLAASSLQYIGMARQDVANKRVYGVAAHLSVERLVYDFTLHINDTISVYPIGIYYCNSNARKIKVTGKDSLLINDGSYRQRLFLADYYAASLLDTLIEGIGSYFGPLAPDLLNYNYCITDVCIPDILLCQKQNGILIYQNSFYHTCYYVDCTTGIQQFANSNEVSIYPNPTSGMVYLNLSAQNAGALLVNITDVNGNQLLHNRFAANEGANSFKLDLSNLNSGVYFINITDENGVPIKNDKLVLMGQ